MTGPARPDLTARDGDGGTRSRVSTVLGDGTVVMLVGTMVSLVGAYAFQLVGGRVLGPVDFAPISVLWTVQFLVMTVVMVPIEQLVIRRLALTHGDSAGLRRSLLPLGGLLLGSAVVVSVVAAALLGRSAARGPWYVALAACLVATYTVFAVARGYLAGRREYHRYGVATAAEALARLLLAAAVLLVTSEAAALGVVLVLAPLAVLVARPFRRRPAASHVAVPGTHTPPGAGADDLTSPFERRLESAQEPGLEPGADLVGVGTGRFLVPLVVANGASQTVLGAGPMVVVALGATPATVSIVFLTFTLFRAPSWVIQSALSRVLPPFTALAGRPVVLRRWARRLATAGVVLAGVGGPLGWWLGPDLVAVLVGADFRPSPALAALVAAGTALAAATLFSAQILVAVGRTGRVAAAWLLALAVAALTLLVPGPPELRVGVAFLAGEVVALAAVTAFAVVGGAFPVAATAAAAPATARDDVEASA